jgi:hypothetical protein
MYYLLFDELRLVKPLTSNPLSGEFYVVAKGFRGISDSNYEKLLTILGNFKENMCFIPQKEIPEDFIEIVSKFKNEYCKDKEYSGLNLDDKLYQLIVDFHLDCKGIKSHDNIYEDIKNDHPKKKYLVKNDYKYYPYDFQQDWLANKNYLGSMCTGEYIFQIDADELPNEFLLQNIKALLEDNPVDVFIVPRINFVEELTDEHIKQWGWRVNEKGWVNYPDPQKRIYRNDPSIKWRDPKDQPQVHGMVTGYKTYAELPYEDAELAVAQMIEPFELVNALLATVKAAFACAKAALA